MITLAHYQIYHLQGDSVNDFLQGQVCSDMRLFEEGSSQLTGVCNAKGRLVASPYVLLKDGAYYLVIEQTMADILFKYWKPYLMISRVQANLCEAQQAYGLMAPDEHNYDYQVSLAGNTEAQIVFSKENLDGACDTSEQEWFSAIVNSGVVLIQAETSKELMPITLGYEKFSALSFNKGCYVGQEILARVHYKGSVKKQVRVVSFAEAIAVKANERIHDEQDKTVGHIALSPTAQIAVKQTLAVLNKNSEANNYYLNDTNKSTISI